MARRLFGIERKRRDARIWLPPRPLDAPPYRPQDPSDLDWPRLGELVQIYGNSADTVFRADRQVYAARVVEHRIALERDRDGVPEGPVDRLRFDLIFVRRFRLHVTPSVSMTGLLANVSQDDMSYIDFEPVSYTKANVHPYPGTTPGEIRETARASLRAGLSAAAINEKLRGYYLRGWLAYPYTAEQILTDEDRQAIAELDEGFGDLDLDARFRED